MYAWSFLAAPSIVIYAVVWYISTGVVCIVFREEPKTCSKHQSVVELACPAFKDGEKRYDIMHIY